MPQDHIRANQVFKTRAGSWAVFSVIAGSLLAFFVWSALTLPPRVPTRERIKLVTPAIALALAGAAWFGAFRLEISETAITYRSLLSRHTILRRDIIAAEFAEHTKPTEGLLIFVLRTQRGEELRINVKPLPLAATQALLALTPAG